MLVITGVGRCGTSALMNFLYRMEFKMGTLGKEMRWSDEHRAGMEHPVVVAINRRLFTMYLNRQSKKKKGMVNIKNHLKRTGLNKLEVVKDPRFTWHPMIINSWAQAMPDLKVLLLHRRLSDVVRSRSKITHVHESELQKDYSKGQLKYDIKQFHGMLHALKIKHRVHIYPKFIDNFDSMMISLFELGLPFNPKEGRETWDKVMDRSMVTFGRSLLNG